MTTGITWTDETWNPVVGCSKISDGCRNCYAAQIAASAKMQKFVQYQKVKEWDGTIAQVQSALDKPLRWKAPKKIFTCSMSDLFHDGLSDAYRDSIFAVMALCPRHTFQILTKRPENAVRYFNRSNLAEAIQAADSRLLELPQIPLKNVWVGVTAENQLMANHRIPLLMQMPAVVRWVSFEPLLESVKLPAGTNLDWAVVGGESGPNYREVAIADLTSTIVGLKTAKVPIWVKQDSAFRSGQQGRISDYLWQAKQFPQVEAAYVLK